VSVQLWNSCCCDCVWRQAYLCSDDSATGKYSEDADIDVTKVYEIADGCVYYAGCYETNGGTEAVILGGPYEDCEECDDPAPCECPEGLEAAYNVAGLITVDGECTDHAYGVTVTDSGECAWQNAGTEVVCFGPDLACSLELVTTTPCYWLVIVDTAIYFRKYGGATPVGTYTRDAGASEPDWSAGTCVVT
jgi:hypothetical protein